MRARVFSHPSCALHDPPSHPERPARLAAALAGASASGARVEEAPRVALDLVRAVHDASMIDPRHGYVDADTDGSASRSGPSALPSYRRRADAVWLDADTFVGPASWEAAMRSAGAAVEAARSALAGRPAFAIARPPGHHATRGTSMGFCLLNNVAIAAAALQRRVAIVDIDVHHGNGTQDIFYDRDDVLYVSLHGWPLYPGTGAASETGRGKGQGFTVNVPLPAGTGDAAWLAAFDARALPAVREFAPDVVLVSAGFDADARDPLGNLALTPATYGACIRRLRDITPRLGVVLEGGYDLDALREGVDQVCRALDPI